MYELMLNLEEKAKKCLYEQIYEHMKGEIQRGNIRCGERLPSTRLLAKQLDVSRSTAQLAYEQLLSEGYIESVPCRGYFVCQMEELYHLEPEILPKAEQEVSAPADVLYDFTPMELIWIIFRMLCGGSLAGKCCRMIRRNCSIWATQEESMRSGL